MKRKAFTPGLLGLLAALSMTVAPTAAGAQRWDRGDYGHDRGWRDGYGGHDRPGDRGRDPYGRGYDRRGYHDRGYYGRHHRCHGGTGGAIVGAIAGGLLGNAVAGYGDRTAGTLIGGGLGALAGNAIGRDC